MKVVYIFSSQGHTISCKPGKMTLPQLEDKLVDGTVIGCFPNLYAVLAGYLPNQVITL